MSIINNIRKALGLSGEEDFSDLDQTAEENPVRQETQSETAPTVARPIEHKNLDVPATTVDIIFQNVIQVFNASLPGFISQSVDANLQRQYLYNQLDDSIKEYLASIEDTVRTNCEIEWNKEREKFHEETEDLRKRTQDLEQKRSALKDSQLSAVRQKRALSERIRDLENQVMRLEAEKEQYELETKAMANKAKAAQVMEEELLKMRSKSEDGQLLSQLSIEKVRLSEENEKLKKEIQSMSQAIEAAKVKDEMSGAMVGNFQKSAAEAQKSNKEMLEKITAYEEEIKLKDAQIQDLKNELAQRDMQLSQGASAEEIQEIQKQISLFEGVKAKMENHIERLKANLKESQSEISSLKTTIQDNLLAQARQEKDLRETIASLNFELENARASKHTVDMTIEANDNYQSQNRRNKHKNKNKNRNRQDQQEQQPKVEEKDDELLSGTDWLVSTPPDDITMRNNAVDDFGYQPPQTKPTPLDNDAQMTLFDFD